MRRLIARLATALRDERGATVVFAAVSMVGLLAMTAFAFDFGRMYVERRELQNGADAAALAIAEDCAWGKCDLSYSASGVADGYADANASDDRAWIQDVDLDLDAQTVHVITGTEDVDGDNTFDMVFAPVVGFDGLTVGAEATAAWGGPGKLKALPLIYSKCEWESFGAPGFVDEAPGNFLHRSSVVRNGLLPPAAGYAYADRYTTIFFHGSNGTCHDSPSGQDLPGGFGWLDVASSCDIELETGVSLEVDPGASPTTGCDPEDLDAMVGTVQFIPYFDAYGGTGENAAYRVYGFGALYVTGFNFGGDYKVDSLIDGNPPCTGDDRCVQGYFIGDWVATDGVLGGPDLGVKIVKLTG